MDDGMKFDEGKLRYDLMPSAAEAEIIAVLSVGAIKYDDNNWAKVSHGHPRYFAAGRRHGEADRAGELVDQDTGLLHLAHEACDVIFRLEKRLQENPDLARRLPARLYAAVEKAKDAREARNGRLSSL